MLWQHRSGQAIKQLASLQMRISELQSQVMVNVHQIGPSLIKLWAGGSNTPQDVN